VKKWLSDEEDNLIYDLVPRICVDVIVRSKKGILLAKRAIEPFKGQWHMIGGRLGKGEDPKDAARRLIKKEIGIDVVDFAFVDYCNHPNDGMGTNEEPRHSVSLVFQTILTGFRRNESEPRSK